MKTKITEWKEMLISYITKHMKPQSIQMTISLSFTIVSVISMGILGVTLQSDGH